jgi:hypothetical protein
MTWHDAGSCCPMARVLPTRVWSTLHPCTATAPVLLLHCYCSRATAALLLLPCYCCTATAPVLLLHCYCSRAAAALLLLPWSFCTATARKCCGVQVPRHHPCASPNAQQQPVGGLSVSLYADWRRAARVCAIRSAMLSSSCQDPGCHKSQHAPALLAFASLLPAAAVPGGWRCSPHALPIDARACTAWRRCMCAGLPAAPARAHAPPGCGPPPPGMLPAAAAGWRLRTTACVGGTEGLLRLPPGAQLVCGMVIEPASVHRARGACSYCGSSGMQLAQLGQVRCWARLLPKVQRSSGLSLISVGQTECWYRVNFALISLVSSVQEQNRRTVFG